MAGVLFFAGLGRLPLVEPDEGRNAEVAREMLVAGDWITPHFNSVAYLEKPPVHYWLMAASFWLWGVTEFAARFPSALMALATMLLTWFLARRLFGDSPGLCAAIVLATSPLFIGFSRFVIFDMTLAFFMTAAMASFWLAAAGGFRQPWLDVTLFGAMGLATLTKGPVGFLLPLFSIVAFQLLCGEFRELKRLRWGLGLLVFLATTLPWFITVSMRNPSFPQHFFWWEHVLRFASGSARRGGNILYYLPVYLGGFFPWSFFLLFAGWTRLKRWQELKQNSQRPVLFLLVWAAVIFFFFSISRSKLPGYILPAIIPVSILMAGVWRDVGNEAVERCPGWLKAGFVTVIGLGLLIAAAPQALRFASLEAVVEQKLHPLVLALLKPSLLYAGLILAGLGVVGRNLAARQARKTLSATAFALLAVAAPLVIVRWMGPLRAYADSQSSRRLARTILQSPERDLPLYAYYCFRTSLPFYLQRPVGLATADGGELTGNYIRLHWPELRRTAIAEAGDLPHPLWIDRAVLHEWSKNSPRPVLVMVYNRNIQDLAQAVVGMDPLWSDWKYSIWKIPSAKPEDGVGRPAP